MSDYHAPMGQRDAHSTSEYSAPTGTACVHCKVDSEPRGTHTLLSCSQRKRELKLRVRTRSESKRSKAHSDGWCWVKNLPKARRIECFRRQGACTLQRHPTPKIIYFADMKYGEQPGSLWLQHPHTPSPIILRCYFFLSPLQNHHLRYVCHYSSSSLYFPAVMHLAWHLPFTVNTVHPYGVVATWQGTIEDVAGGRHPIRASP